MGDDATFLHHEPCPECGSQDNLARYSDGHAYCFGCEHHEAGDSEPSTDRGPKPKTPTDLIESHPITRTIRGITPETFGFWKYGEGTLKGKDVHVANHRVKGRTVGQKIRGRGKKFAVRGDLEPLYGMWLWSGQGRMIVVTEGEIDALSVSQAQGNKWPVVSLPNGAQGGTKAIKKSLQWLTGYDKVVFMFDEDEPGQEAAEACAKLLPPGRAAITTLSAKDPNEMLQAGDGDAIVRAVWDAKTYRPDGIVSLADCIEAALKPPEWGSDLPFPTMTEMMFGTRHGEWYALGAGVGVGKSDFETELIAHEVTANNQTVGVLALEQPNGETAKRIAGKIDGKLYHVPDEEIDTNQLERTLRSIEDKVFLYDHFGSSDWETISGLIRYLAHGCGCTTIYLDHLTAVASHADDERRYLDKVCSELAGLCQELQIKMWVVSHLTTPKGESHEEGGRVQEKHFTGSRAIARWAHFMFGLERNKQDEDEEARHVTCVRCLKDRYTGRGTGKTFYIRYDQQTGRLTECEPPDSMFKDESNDDESEF